MSVYQLKDESFIECPSLKRELNSVLRDIQVQADNAAAIQSVYLEPVVLRIGGSVSSVFPFRFGGPTDFTPKGLFLANKEIIDSTVTVSSSELFTSAVDFHWRPLPDGNLELRWMTGLSANHTYRFTFKAEGTA